MIRKIFTADIGGTNSRFAHFTSDDSGLLTLHEEKWLRSNEVASFYECIHLLEEQSFSLLPRDADFSAVALAGPIEHGTRCKVTNVLWEPVDLLKAEKEIGTTSIALINDFVAQAFACRTPLIERAAVVLPGTEDKNATLGVIGAGTGLGKCGLVPLPHGGYVPVSSEGGHTDLPFLNSEEQEFAAFCRQKTGRKHVTGDVVLTGSGLQLLQTFLTGEELTAKEVTARFKEQSQGNRTFELWATFFGRACRNYALEIMALGGLYISGGIVAKVPELVMNPFFKETFHSSDTHADLLARLPVSLNKEENAGLWGAALYGAQAFELKKKG